MNKTIEAYIYFCDDWNLKPSDGESLELFYLSTDQSIYWDEILPYLEARLENSN